MRRAAASGRRRRRGAVRARLRTVGARLDGERPVVAEGSGRRPCAARRRPAPRRAPLARGARRSSRSPALGDVRPPTACAGDEHAERAGRLSRHLEERGPSAEDRWGSRAGLPIATSRANAVARRLASRRSTEEEWKTSTVTTPMTALTATSSAATMTRSRRRRVHGPARRARAASPSRHRSVAASPIGSRRRGRRLSSAATSATAPLRFREAAAYPGSPGSGHPTAFSM